MPVRSSMFAQVLKRFSSAKSALHLHRNILQGFKLATGEKRFQIVEELVKRNVEITKINSIIQSLMQISRDSDAYRIFMIYVGSGRKMDGLVEDSRVFDYVISLLVRNGRMDEAERVCFEQRIVITRAERELLLSFTTYSSGTSLRSNHYTNK